MGLQQLVRERVLYAYGYLQGRSFAIPSKPSELYAFTIAKLTSLIALPLPLLSFVALPLYGGSSTTVSLIFFYLTWTALVVSHGPLAIEIYGTLAVRGLFLLLPALAFLAFDLALPRLSQSMKARRDKQLPGTLGIDKVGRVAGWAVFNVLLSVLLQATLELVLTQVLHLRSLLRVTTIVPLPWTIVLDILKGLVVRGVLHYSVHRFVLHSAHDNVLQTWHLDWHHSIQLPFSLVAAYDHPINYLVAEFLPTLAPALLMRWHVITWHLYLVLASLEELFVFSGYSVLPSTIMLTGMARRMDAHFDSVRKRKQVGNFGHIGVLDFVLGTACANEVNVFDDVQGEAEKYRFQERVNDAVTAALAAREEKEDGGRSRSGGAADDDDAQPPRRSGRRRRKDG